jgi:hypothetical protein
MANFEDWSRELEQSIADFEKQKTNILIQVTKTIEAVWKQRIFNLGRDVNGTIIGVYSTKATWASIEAFDKEGAFQPAARKRAVNKGKNPGGAGSPRTTIDLPGGYSELRQIQGKKSDFVNLDYTASLRLNFQIGTRGEVVVFGTTNTTETAKKKGLERHFNKEIFSLSEEEVEIGTEVFAKLVSKYLFR